MQIKALVCCDTVDMLGDLWVSMFSAGSVAVVLLIVTFAYIGKLDRLPRRRCTPFCLICSQDYLKQYGKRMRCVLSNGLGGMRESPVARYVFVKKASS